MGIGTSIKTGSEGAILNDVNERQFLVAFSSAFLYTYLHSEAA
jgi:hypothetical protein